MPVRALVLGCTLKTSPSPSSSWQLGQEVLEQLESFDAHRVTAECLQALNDTGFSIAANAVHLARLLQSDGYPAA